MVSKQVGVVCCSLIIRTDSGVKNGHIRFTLRAITAIIFCSIASIYCISKGKILVLKFIMSFMVLEVILKLNIIQFIYILLLLLLLLLLLCVLTRSH